MPYILNQSINNLSCYGIEIKRVLADTNYSSGDTLKYLENHEIVGYIPCTGNYKSNREGFIYDVKNDCYLCWLDKKLTFKYIHKVGSSQKESRIYRNSVEDCNKFPLRNKVRNRILKNYRLPLISHIMIDLTKEYIVLQVEG